MIKISETLKSLINSRLLNFFYLVEIGDHFTLTTAPYDIAMNNGKIYSSDSSLLGVQPPQITNVVDRAAYKLTFADSKFMLKSYFESGAVGDKVVVRLGFYNTFGHVVDNTEPGMYFNQLTNTLVAYSGVVDNQTIDIKMDDMTVVASIECSSPMADLDLVRSFHSNKDSMKTRNPSDTAFDQVFEGSSEISYKWGKK